MTPQFDAFLESVITEYTSNAGKRSTSRYWNSSIYPKAQPRKVSSLKNHTASQRTKLGNQQYIGNFFGDKGVRGKNDSEKSPAEIGIAKGLGNVIKVKGVNPKKPGTTVNSKQGNMEVKYVLPNGSVRVGAKRKTNYNFMQKRHQVNEEYIHIAPENAKYHYDEFSHVVPEEILANGIYIDNIFVPKYLRGKGLVKQEFQKLLQSANEQGKYVFLQAYPYEHADDGMDVFEDQRKKLEEIYTRYGFISVGDGWMYKAPTK